MLARFSRFLPTWHVPEMGRNSIVFVGRSAPRAVVQQVWVIRDGGKCWRGDFRSDRKAGQLRRKTSRGERVERMGGHTRRNAYVGPYRVRFNDAIADHGRRSIEPRIQPGKRMPEHNIRQPEANLAGWLFGWRAESRAANWSTACSARARTSGSTSLPSAKSLSLP